MQLFAHGGGIHGQPGGAVGGIGGHCQRAGVRHGAQIDAVFQRFAVQVLGAAFHPQLVAGAVVQHKAGLARSQRRAGVAALDAGKAGTAKAIHRTGILVHGHKAAGHGLHGRQLPKTGLLRPAHRRGQGDMHRIHQILYPGDGRAHRAGGKQGDQRKHRQNDDGAAQTAAVHPLTRCLQIFHTPGGKRLSVRVAAAAMKLFHGCSSFSG